LSSSSSLCCIGLIPTCINFVTIIRNEDECTNSYTLLLFWSPHKKSNINNVKHKNDVSNVLLMLRILILAFSLLMCFKLCHNFINKQAHTTTTKNGNLSFIWNYDGKLTYFDIIKATRHFDIRYCIGNGACVSVYKTQ
jgi:hypothetical protein